MPESILTILKLCFLALLYLFMARVIRTVWIQISDADNEGVTAAGPETVKSRQRRSRPTKLQIKSPRDRAGTTYEVDHELTIGRASGCAIAVPDDSYASQLHARVFVRDGNMYVEDLGSTNGTTVNGKQLTEARRLKNGDRIEVGHTTFEVTK